MTFQPLITSQRNIVIASRWLQTFYNLLQTFVHYVAASHFEVAAWSAYKSTLFTKIYFSSPLIAGILVTLQIYDNFYVRIRDSKMVRSQKFLSSWFHHRLVTSTSRRCSKTSRDRTAPTFLSIPTCLTPTWPGTLACLRSLLTPLFLLTMFCWKRNAAQTRCIAYQWRCHAASNNEEKLNPPIATLVWSAVGSAFMLFFAQHINTSLVDLVVISRAVDPEPEIWFPVPQILFVGQASCTINAMVFSFQWIQSFWGRSQNLLDVGASTSGVLHSLLLFSCRIASKGL